METSIKYRIKHLGKIIIGCATLIVGGISLLLIVEYRFFHDQAQKMLELKEEYRTYTLAVKKILNEYNALKEQANSSTNTSDPLKNSFLVVNRESDYLKQSMIDHARKENLEFIVNAIDAQDWTDYTDQIKKTTSSAKKKKIIRSRPRPKKPPFSFNQSTIPAIKDITLVWPIDRSQFWLSSFFGPRKKTDQSWGFHYGIDMAACKGTPVMASADGIVIEAYYNSGYGNTILISHTNKYKTRYAHLDKILVSVGQKVCKGMLIGKVGATGAVRKKKGRDPSHLHFEVYAHGKQVNPLSFFV